MLHWIYTRSSLISNSDLLHSCSWDLSFTEEEYKQAYKTSIQRIISLFRQNPVLTRSLSYTNLPLWRWVNENSEIVTINKSVRRNCAYLAFLLQSRALKSQLGSMTTKIIVSSKNITYPINTHGEVFIYDEPRQKLMSPDSYRYQSQLEREVISSGGNRYWIEFSDGQELISCTPPTSTCNAILIAALNKEQNPTSIHDNTPDSNYSDDLLNVKPIEMSSKMGVNYEWGYRTAIEKISPPLSIECQKGIWDILRAQDACDVLPLKETEVSKNLYILLEVLRPAFNQLYLERLRIGKMLAQEQQESCAKRITFLEFVSKNAERIIRNRLMRATAEELWELCSLNRKCEIGPITIPPQGYENVFALEFLVRFIQRPEDSLLYDIVVDNISPAGVLSSRSDYLTGFDSQPILTKCSQNMRMPVDVINTMWLSSHYHALRRNKVTPYVIVIGPDVVLPLNVHSIPINELTLDLDEDGIPSLYWGAKPIEPLWRTTMSPRVSVLTLLLRIVSRLQPEVPEIPQYIPFGKPGMHDHVRLENLLLSPRKWVYPGAEFIDISPSNMNYVQYQRVRKLLKNQEVPRFVFVMSNKYKSRRALDTESPLSLQLLHRHSQDEYVILEEVHLPKNISDEEYHHTQHLIGLKTAWN